MKKLTPLRRARATLLACIALGAFTFQVRSASLPTAAQKHWTADNGNGTYSNPLFYGEFEDPDVIRVGEDYYLAGTTMHMNPAVEILHSKDLVNWELAGYCTNRLDLGPAYRLEGGNIYGRGIWAPCLRYHKGVFYIFSNVNGAQLQVFRSKSINGPWEHNTLPGRHDLSVLFDDDLDKIFIISGGGSPYPIEEIAPDLKSFVPGVRHQLVVPAGGTRMGEGHHLYKINGKYIDVSAIPGGAVNQVVAKADSIDGPWTVTTMVESESLGVTAAPSRARPNDSGLWLHQGGMCDTPSGQWWSVIMSDHGSAGRMVSLVPITWDDGFPLIGLPGNLRKAPNTWLKPDTGFTQEPNPTYVPDDNFNDGKKNPHWQWNHVPDDSKWSLTEKPGVLRLHSLPAGGSPMLVAGELANLRSLAGKLRLPTRAIDTWVAGNLSSATQAALTNSDAPGPFALQELLLEDLNKILRGPSIYESQRFGGIALGSETQTLMARNPQGNDLLRLNRLLIEDAYPLEVMKKRNDFYVARNSICQRPPGPESIMTVELDTTGLAPGDNAGLALLCNPYAWIGVVKTAEGSTLQMLQGSGGGGRGRRGGAGRGAAIENNQPTVSPTAPPNHLWLRVHCNFDNDQAVFSWSADGKQFTPLGTWPIPGFQLQTFQGVRPSLFNYNTSGQPGGYADFDNYICEEPRARGIEREIPLGKTIILTSGADESILQADTDKNVLFNAAKAETKNAGFQVVDVGLGRVALKASNGKFVSNDGDAVTLKDLAGKTPGETESFQWVNLLRGDTMLMSLVNHRYIATKPNEPGIVKVSALGPTPARKGGECFKWKAVE